MQRLLKGLLTGFLCVGSLTALADDVKVIGALGDSMTVGFNARRLGENRDLSWSTGTSTEVNSHLRRLTALTGHEITGYNEAVTGSVAADLDRQITRLLPQEPDYVTVTVGANDVCSWGEDYLGALQDYENALRAAVQKLIAARPEIKVFIAPIPDMYNLWEVASQHSGCQQVWSFFGICRPLLGAGRSDLDRQGFVTRWRAANEAIAQVATEFPDNAVYDARLMDTKFEWEHVSTIDCFHPSVAGQNLLAEKAWQVVQ